VVVISTKEVDCLKEVPQNLQKFIDDEGEKITPTVQCLQTALHTFSRRFKGENDNVYRATELQHFLNRYLLQKNQIIDSFMAELMKFKVLVVGGSLDGLTREEIEQLCQILEAGEPAFDALQGQMKLLSFRDLPGKGLGTEATELQVKLQDLAKFLLARTKVTESHYEFEDFKSFVHELDHFLNGSKSLQSLLRWMPLAESVKLVFWGPHASLRSTSEWQESAKWVINGYLAVLQFYYGIRHLDLSSPADWEQLLPWLDGVLSLVEVSPAMRANEKLSATALDQLIDDLWKLELFHTSLDPTMIKETYRKILVHFIEGRPGGIGNAVAIDGLSAEDLRLLQLEYHAWEVTQRALDRLYLQKQNWSVPELRAQIQALPVESLLERLNASHLEHEEIARSWSDFVELFSLHPVTVIGPDSKMVTMYYNDIARTSFSGMLQLNAVKSAVRLVFRGYGDHSSAAVFDTQLSEAGMVRFEEDFRDFGRAIGLLDPRQVKPAERTFKEGNFFSYHGNGDQNLSATEFYEQVNMLLTGGSVVVGQIFHDLQAQKCLLPEKDIFGHPLAQEDCFLRVFRKNIKVYLHHLPWMAQYLSHLSEADFYRAYQLLLKVGRLPTARPHQLEWVEIRTITTVLQYVESIYTIYDTDKDQRLSADEVRAATPRFADFITHISPLKDHMVQDIFLYLVFKGEKPSGLMDLLAFKAKSMTGLPKVDRMNLFQVIGVLKTQAN
jgi:hypothetical protein